MSGKKSHFSYFASKILKQYFSLKWWINVTLHRKHNEKYGFIDQLMYRKYTWNFVTNGLWNKSHFYLCILHTNDEKNWKKKIKTFTANNEFYNRKQNSARCTLKFLKFSFFEQISFVTSDFTLNLLLNILLRKRFIRLSIKTKTTIHGFYIIKRICSFTFKQFICNIYI